MTGSPKSGASRYCRHRQPMTALGFSINGWTDPNPTSRDKTVARGMSIFHDWVDWVGGYPFEAEKPEEVIQHLKQKGMHLAKTEYVGKGHGYNEYSFAQM